MKSINSPRSIATSALLAFLVAITTIPSASASGSMPGDMTILRARHFDAESYLPPESSNFKSLAPSTFEANYVNVPPNVQGAIDHALGLWANRISSSVPIRIEVRWQSLGQDVLAAAGASLIHRDFPGAPNAETWYVDALADALTGVDQAPDQPDIVAALSSDVPWYLGTDGTPETGTFDLVTVVLHEVAHGLGFSASMRVTNGSGAWGFGTDRPLVYDAWIRDAAGSFLVDRDTFANPSTELAAAIESGQLSFSGPLASAANNGQPPRLYAPLPWLEGLSISHLDEGLFPVGHPSSLMTPFLASSEAIHDPGEVALCLLEDLGWQTTCSQLAGGTCTPNDTVLCLDGIEGDNRFSVSLQFATSLGGGLSGSGQAVALAQVGQPRGGTISFFDSRNPEVLIKILDGCAVNGHFWVFFAAATNAGFELTVEDTITDDIRNFSNPDLHRASAVTATDAFATCP